MIADWDHLSDTEIAKEIRERVFELNEIVKAATARDICITYKITHEEEFNQMLEATTTQRI